MELYGTLRFGEKFRNFMELFNVFYGTEQLCYHQICLHVLFCFGGGQNRGTGNRSSPVVQEQSPGGGLGAKHPEGGDIYANNHCNNVLTKNH